MILRVVVFSVGFRVQSSGQKRPLKMNGWNSFEVKVDGSDDFLFPNKVYVQVPAFNLPCKGPFL